MSQPRHNKPVAESGDQPPRKDQPRDIRPIPPPDRWMSALPEDLLICDINIPGSHDAAAINTRKRTRWACQGHSISEQLEKGIRLLDIRLKPKKRRDTGAKSAKHPPTTPQTTDAAPRPTAATHKTAAEFDFVTCHGHLGLFGANEFQPLDELLDKCMAFLQAHPGEALLLLLKIDDWRGTRKQERGNILQALQAKLNALPRIDTPQMPTLGQCRGKIYVINRINDDPTLGVPLDIPANTPGTALKPTAHRHYEVYVQDQYKRLNLLNPEAHKLRLTIAAFARKRPGEVLLNFASATKPIGRFVYIMRELLRSPIAPVGWLLLDYALSTELPNSIIAGNF